MKNQTEEVWINKRQKLESESSDKVDKEIPQEQKIIEEKEEVIDKNVQTL